MVVVAVFCWWWLWVMGQGLGVLWRQWVMVGGCLSRRRPSPRRLADLLETKTIDHGPSRMPRAACFSPRKRVPTSKGRERPQLEREREPPACPPARVIAPARDMSATGARWRAPAEMPRAGGGACCRPRPTRARAVALFIAVLLTCLEPAAVLAVARNKTLNTMHNKLQAFLQLLELRTIEVPAAVPAVARGRLVPVCSLVRAYDCARVIALVLLPRANAPCYCSCVIALVLLPVLCPVSLPFCYCARDIA
jgi:hypothetical protein